MRLRSPGLPILVASLALCGGATSTALAQSPEPAAAPQPKAGDVQVKPGACPEGRHMVGGRCLRAPAAAKPADPATAAPAAKDPPALPQ